MHLGHIAACHNTKWLRFGVEGLGVYAVQQYTIVIFQCAGYDSRPSEGSAQKQEDLSRAKSVSANPHNF